MQTVCCLFIYKENEFSSQTLIPLVVISWCSNLGTRLVYQPLPTCRKLRFLLFFPIIVDPLNLDYQNQAMHIPVVSRVPPKKFEANRSRGSWVLIGHTNVKQTNKNYKNSIKYKKKLFIVRLWVAENNEGAWKSSSFAFLIRT